MIHHLVDVLVKIVIGVQGVKWNGPHNVITHRWVAIRGMLGYVIITEKMMLEKKEK